jgi:hypothetical protein
MGRRSNPMTIVDDGASSYQEALRRKGRPVAAMPDHDPVIEGTEPALRRAIGETWLRRAHEELKASMGFAVLSQKLLEVGAAPDAMARVARAVGDEVRHAEICRALASRYLGEDAPWPSAVPVDVGPRAHDEDRLVRASLHTVTMACVNETIAAVFIEASLDGATAPSARAALGLILADEVEHGRAGWLYLGTVMRNADVVRAIQRELGAIVRKVAACWFDDTCITLPDGAEEHGLPSNEATRRSVITALRDIVIPGFEQLGFDAAEARELVSGRAL